MLLMTGLIPWMWTMKAISTSSVSILNGQSLMLQTGVQPIFFPLVMLLQSTIKQIPVFALLIGFVWLKGSPPGMHWFAILPIFVVQALFTLSASLAIAAIIPFIRDLTNLVPTGLTLLMFLSGIFYDYSTINERWHGLFLLNPVAFLIKSYRDVFLDQTSPDMTALAWRGILCGVACVALFGIYRRLRYVYPRVVME
jgi:lipopolysaccharide transport system permease protein